jgi:nicotinamide riboside transporter PnuC
MLKKDWTQQGKAFLLIFAVMFALAFVTQEQWRIGGMSVIVFTSSYYYVYNVYTKEVGRRTMEMMLGLPIPPVYLIIAKFVAVYSMGLVTVNVPGALLLDQNVLYLLNAEMLFVSTLSMTFSVMWANPLAAAAPLVPILLAFQQPDSFNRFRPYEYPAATAALALLPVMVGASVLLFKRRARVR